MMRLGTRQECIESSSRVLGVCKDGAREFAGRGPRLVGRKPRLTRRLSRVAERLARSLEGLEVDVYGPKIQLRHRAKDWTMRRELGGSSLGDSPKGSGSSLGTRREITGGRP
ncbi:hypothetical protein GW17_00058982 [Ensete ventricosum]|nr:hypothetical protein GW17_00058982 [Ensete ventricosum]